MAKVSGIHVVTNGEESLNNHVPAVYKAFKILELIASCDAGWLSISEICKQLEYSKSTVHSILNTMKDLHYIEQDLSSKKYGLGIKHHELGNAYRKRTKFIDLFSLIAKKITDECDETVFLAVLDGTDIVYMGKEESSQPLRMAGQVGKRLPAHITSLGKCLLSSLPSNEVLKLYSGYKFKKVTSNSIDNFQDLQRELDRVKKQGYAIDDRETSNDVECVGAPIRNYRGEVVASISIAVPSTRMSQDRKEKLIILVMETAKEFSYRLGYVSNSRQLVSLRGNIHDSK